MYLLFIMHVSFCKNYWVIFRESLAKAWRKMAFLRKLGGLNRGLVVSELADESEQGPTS